MVLVFTATNPATGTEQEYQMTSDYILIGQQHVNRAKESFFICSTDQVRGCWQQKGYGTFPGG